MMSPYANQPVEHWAEITRSLIERHPLSSEELVTIVLKSWDVMFESTIGTRKIGVHIFPKPQIMGFFLNELVAAELEERYTGLWRGDLSADEKDLVYLLDDFFSIEMKTSSSSKQIFGNRSYAQKGDSKKAKKNKSGYYLAVNFEKFTPKMKQKPRITLIRFGWLDHEDWQGQKAATGQQARLDPVIEQNKLLPLYTIK